MLNNLSNINDIFKRIDDIIEEIKDFEMVFHEKK